MPTNNRTSAKAKGNTYPDLQTFTLLQSIVASLVTIASALSGGFLAWTRQAGSVILSVITDNVGIGTVTPTSKLTVAGPIATTHRASPAGNDAFGVSDSWIEKTVAAGADTCSLPAASAVPGEERLLSLAATGGGTASYLPSGADTIDGGASPALSVVNDYAAIKSDGVGNWKLMAAKVGGSPA